MRILSLSVATFLTVLIITRFKEIARFTALSGNIIQTFCFTAYQFPLILPIAIPISAFIASLLLLQRMSRSHELTALRASGCSLGLILAPLLFAAALLAIGNFSICAEIAPHCRKSSKAMLFRETSVNPLLLLERQQLVRIKNAYFNMQMQEEGKRASDLILIAENAAHKRLGLFMARELSVEGEKTLLGRDVTLISHLNENHHLEEDGFDPLIIDNQAWMSTAAPLLSQFLKRNRPRLETNAMSVRMLRLRSLVERKKIASAASSEILRRVSLSLAVFSFTLIGATFGIEVGRTPKRRIAVALALVLLILISFLSLKELKAYPLLALFVSLSPHLLSWVLSCHRLRQIAHGSA